MTGDVPEALFSVERRAVANAVEKRKREFQTGRACARAALQGLGLPRVAIPVGDRGQPLWPDGVVGSITHCDGYRACAAARRVDIASIGIDAEPYAPLPGSVLTSIATPAELRRLAARRDDVHLDRILFSAKEAVFKAWFAYADCPVGFRDCDIAFDLDTASFRATVTPRARAAGARGLPADPLTGRWRAQDGIVVTAAVIPAPTTPGAYERAPSVGAEAARPTWPRRPFAASAPERKHDSIATPLR